MAIAPPRRHTPYAIRHTPYAIRHTPYATIIDKIITPSRAIKRQRQIFKINKNTEAIRYIHGFFCAIRPLDTLHYLFLSSVELNKKENEMKLKASIVDIFLFIIILTIGTLSRLNLLPDDATAVAALIQRIEFTQGIWLVFGALFTLQWCKKNALSATDRHFWLWVALWWLLLLGRHMSWGRIAFPAGPALLYRAIPLLLIMALAIPLCFRSLRGAIAERARRHPVPLWTLGAVIGAFILADAVEHQRAYVAFLQPENRYKELIEEMFECPFMLGLFQITRTLIAAERRVLRQTVKNGPP
ncbi:hypothetical protein AABD69_04370 [Edwardsiella piscicida]|uniref:hypothetical protein n=1 Tax=Edwardsiella piscicida TaxID=1263550 RepID=UPI000A7AC608